MTSQDFLNIINNPASIKEAKAPKASWTYLLTDTKNYNVDFDIYKDEAGNLFKVDADWRFGF